MAAAAHRGYASLHQGPWEVAVMTSPGDGKAAAGGDRGRLRTSRADREQVVDALKAAFVQGRLDKDEFDARVGQAFASRTYAELAALTGDIPAGPAASPSPRVPPQPRARVHVSIKTGAGVIVAAVVLEALRLGATWPQTVLAVFAALVFGVIVAGIVALPIAGVLKLESRHRRRSGGQLPRSTPGTGGQASGRQAPAASAEQFPPLDRGQQHTTEAVRRDLASPQPSGPQPSIPQPSSLRPRDRCRPRRRCHAIGYVAL